jgi:hypothetical protein
VGLRNAQKLCLRAGHVAVEPGVAEERGTLALAANLSRLALREELPLAHPAVAADDVERNHDPVTGRDLLDRFADLLDDAHRLVPEDVAFGHEHAEHRVEMEI